MKDLKYLIAYIAPLAAYAGIYLGGIWSLGAFYVGFGLIPLLEFIVPASPENLDTEEENRRAASPFFDWLLYLNIPILYGLIWYYFSTIQAGDVLWWEIVMMTMSVGLVIGTIGINVAHELGHRTSKVEQFLSKVLLLSALYMHFNIEHNRGHHKNVATDKDPASARMGESLYGFWIRSLFGSYVDAWRLEAERLRRAKLPVVSIHNEMIWFQLAQLLYLLGVGALFGWSMIGIAIAVAFNGIFLLETVNYIEHYGLRRKKLPSGRYENVMPSHSWNSDHQVGRIFLYELTRHSDHHFKATRKYQVLRHMDDSPQLPCGYPSAMILALVPPLWFKVMDKRLKEEQVATPAVLS